MNTLADSKVLQILSFVIENDIYALEVNLVKEVLEMKRLIHIPNMPGYVKGVINIRGKVVPVIDMRIKFNLPEISYGNRTSIIVVEIPLDGKIMLIGLITDSVDTVLDIAQEQLLPAPDIGGTLTINYIKNMVSKDDIFIMLLNLYKLLDVEELVLLNQVKEAVNERS